MDTGIVFLTTACAAVIVGFIMLARNNDMYLESQHTLFKMELARTERMARQTFKKK